ncbi:hypothetical protein ACP275_08G136400 [Erythranthe tilingii]
MPSGSKRRKAAKKKKENQPNSSSVSPRSQGDDDVKHHSDVGEVSSPGSQDGRSNSNEEIEKIEAGDQEPSKAGEGIIVIQREIKNGNESDGGSSESSSSSGSSSGSDDESHGVKSGDDVADNSPVDSVQVTDEEIIYSTAIEDSCDSVEEIISVNVELVEEKEVEVSTDSPAVDHAPPHIVESVLNGENEEKQGSCSVGGEVGLLEASIDAIIESVEGEARILEASNDAVITPVETVVSISETKECVVAQETEDNGAGIEISSGVTEPLLARAPRPVEMASWKNCCGLFEVFSGSGR